MESIGSLIFTGLLLIGALIYIFWGDHFTFKHIFGRFPSQTTEEHVKTILTKLKNRCNLQILYGKNGVIDVWAVCHQDYERAVEIAQRFGFETE